MTKAVAYRHFQESTVHFYTECPEGKVIGIAKRDVVDTLDESAMAGLVLCEWCRKEAKR